MKIYDLSQPLNQDCSFWPYYPPFEVKYIKRKSEHGVNAQYIQTSNHMGTHLDAPRHFVTKGKTIDEIPIEWCYGPGVIVDLSDMLDDLDLFRPEDIEKRVEGREGDLLFIHTGWHRYSFFSPEGAAERYLPRPPRTRRPPAGRGIPGRGRPRALAEGSGGGRRQVRRRQGGRALPRIGLPAHPQRPLPTRLHPRREHGRRHGFEGPAQQAPDAGRLPVEVQGRRSRFLPRRGVVVGKVASGQWSVGGGPRGRGLAERPEPGGG